MSKICWCGCEKTSKYSEHYNVCDNCYTLITNADLSEEIYKVKDEEKDLYGKNYWEQQMLQLTGKNSLDEVIDFYLRERTIYWLKYLLKYKLPGSSIAEIGCGLGQLPYMTKQSGYHQIAYELSPEICSFVKKQLNVNIICGEIGNSSETYDGILAYDLIEHILEPNRFLSDITKKLNPDGILCFQTPCFDNALTYDKMLSEKPRFVNQLKQREHVYIYNQQSLSTLLKSFGFEYINFEPAFFGDDYDMFVFASRNPLKMYSEQDIDCALNKTDNGRIIKALTSLFDERNDLMQKLIISEHDATKRLENLGILTEQLHVSEDDRSNRLNSINILTKQLLECENDRAARLDVILQQNTIIEKMSLQNQNYTNDLGTKMNEIESLLGEKKRIEVLYHELNADYKNLYDKNSEIVVLTEKLTSQLTESLDINENLNKQLIMLNVELNGLKEQNMILTNEKNSLKMTLRNVRRIMLRKLGRKS